MKPQAFIEMVRRRQESCLALLEEKALEYAPGEDRLSNFKRAGAVLGVKPIQALVGMLVKHWVSIAEMVQSGREYSPEKWAEKIEDAINYMYLLEALLEEGRKEGPSDAPGD
jgi:hypothetical protein